MENEKFEEMQEAMEKIREATNMSAEKLADIDTKQKELRDETRIAIFEENKKEIDQMRQEKQEFDEMTINALVNMKKDILIAKRELSEYYRDEMQKITEEGKNAKMRRDDIEKKTQRMKERAIERYTGEKLAEELKNIETTAERTLENYKPEIINENILRLEEERKTRFAELEEWENEITNYALDLGAVEQLDKVSIDDIVDEIDSNEQEAIEQKSEPEVEQNNKEGIIEANESEQEEKKESEAEEKPEDQKSAPKNETAEEKTENQKSAPENETVEEKPEDQKSAPENETAEEKPETEKQTPSNEENEKPKSKVVKPDNTEKITRSYSQSNNQKGEARTSTIQRKQTTDEPFIDAPYIELGEEDEEHDGGNHTIKLGSNYELDVTKEVNGIKKFGSKVKQFFKGFGSKVKDFFKNVIDKVISKVKSLTSSKVEVIGEGSVEENKDKDPDIISQRNKNEFVQGLQDKAQERDESPLDPRYEELFEEIRNGNNETQHQDIQNTHEESESGTEPADD